MKRIKQYSLLILFLTMCSLLIVNYEIEIKDSSTLQVLSITHQSGKYVLIDTDQTMCYDTSKAISYPQIGESFYGQDAQYQGVQPAYQDNGDGTITDLKTGLMWQKDPGNKMTYAAAVSGANTFNLAGYTDWRLPSIKELYSLIQFSGTDPSGWQGTDTSSLTPFIDTDYFTFRYGNPSEGDRIIDSQYASSTKYLSVTMGGSETMFGVNFADGRIKGYPTINKDYYVMYVRGNVDYGKNSFVDNGDGTINDTATGLMWMQDDSGVFKVGDNSNGALNWEQALNWAADLEYAGYSDWRLPNVKELQSLVDYTRAPDTNSSAAIDPIFNVTSITDEGGGKNYPFYWSSTTHATSNGGASSAAYVAFGEALGYMETPPESGNYQLQDVHGAGAQRSDPKSGNPDNYPYGHGPQGDVIRIYNYVRCVRGGSAEIVTEGPEPPNPVPTPGFLLLNIGVLILSVLILKRKPRKISFSIQHEKSIYLPFFLV